MTRYAPRYVCALCANPAERYAVACPSCEGTHCLRLLPSSLPAGEAPAARAVSSPAFPGFSPHERSVISPLKATSDVFVPNDAQGEAHRRPTKIRARSEPVPRILIGLGNVDVAFGGGLVPGSAVLLSGDPGAGKSTLSLLLLEAIGDGLYVSAEEGAEQIEDRATRIGRGIGCFFYCSEDLDSILEYARGYRAVIIDSVHALRGKVEDNSRKILRYCRESKSFVLCIARRVKDGSIAGSAEIVYDFDADISLVKEVDSTGMVHRFIQTGVKNRYGAAGKWPLYMTDEGWIDGPRDGSQDGGAGSDDEVGF